MTRASEVDPTIPQQLLQDQIKCSQLFCSFNDDVSRFKVMQSLYDSLKCSLPDNCHRGKFASLHNLTLLARPPPLPLMVFLIHYCYFGLG